MNHLLASQHGDWLYGRLRSRAQLLALCAALLIALPCSAFGQEERPRSAPERREGNLRVGHAAPTFEIDALDNEERFDLRDWHGKKPVVLIFGSYT